MSDISLQRYKARRAFKTLNEDKRMDNSEYIRLKSIIETVKGTKKTVVEEAVEEAVAAPKNRVYIFIMDDTFSTGMTAGDNETVGTPTGYFTKVSRNSVSDYSSGDTTDMEYYNHNSSSGEDIIKVFYNNKPSDDTNHYHYIKVGIPVGLNVIDTNNEYDDLAIAINHALVKSLAMSNTQDNDTIIERIIVAHGTDDIEAAYTVSSGLTDITAYNSTIDDNTKYDHISNVDSIISSIEYNVSSDYVVSNTIVVYPHNNSIGYDGNQSEFFRERMSEQNNDKYTLLYTEWSRVDDIEYAPSPTVYSGTNTLTSDTHHRLGEKLAALE